MEKKNINYYYFMADVQFENGCQSVLALRTIDSDYEIVKLHFLSWSRGFLGISLLVERLERCSLRDYNRITTRITW